MKSPFELQSATGQCYRPTKDSPKAICTKLKLDIRQWQWQKVAKHAGFELPDIWDTPAKTLFNAVKPLGPQYAAAYAAIVSRHDWHNRAKCEAGWTSRMDCQMCGAKCDDAMHRRYDCPGLEHWDKLDEHTVIRQRVREERRCRPTPEQSLWHELGVLRAPTVPPPCMDSANAVYGGTG